MPRRMGELRRLLVEWNDLVPLARERGITRIQLNDQRVSVRTRPITGWHMSRQRARDHLQILRASVAPFFAPNSTTAAATAEAEDTFGVELEMLLPIGTTASEIAEKIRALGVFCQAEQYSHNTRDHWKIVTDGSLGHIDRGREMVSPPLKGEAGLEQVRRVCSILTSLNCKVTKKCGLHVHIGTSNYQDKMQWWKNLMLIYSQWEGAIDSFMAHSRRGDNNMYAHPIRIDQDKLRRATNVSEIAAAVDQSFVGGARSNRRYRKVNLLSFLQCGTVEFRQHQGTVEIRKTEMWIRFLLRLVKAADTLSTETIATSERTLESLLYLIQCNTSECSYFFGRRAHFSNLTRLAS